MPFPVKQKEFIGMAADFDSFSNHRLIKRSRVMLKT
jgi:hypothetical protein